METLNDNLVYLQIISGQSYRKLEPKKIYLIRHGQTEYNHKGIIQGRSINSQLSRKGFQQARAFYETYRHIPFQRIYISTLQRTFQTVQPFIDDGIPFTKLSGLDEICWGKSEGLFANGNDNKNYYHVIESWKQGNLDLSLDGGESPLEVRERQEKAISRIVSQPEKLVLVCMHGRAMRIMLSWITGMDLSDMDKFEHDNLSLYILKYDDGQFTIEAFNKRDHLHDDHF